MKSRGTRPKARTRASCAWISAGRHLFVQVLSQVFFDFRPADHLLLERRLDGQARNLAHLLKNFVGLRKEVLSRLLLGDSAS